MRIAVTGSIATDHLMRFAGSFTEQLIPDQLDKISLSFLVDDLEVRRGGTAANIAYGLGNLGLTPVLVGSVGNDFAEYRVRLKEHGVDTESVHVSPTRASARFICLTDRRLNQIAAFHTGAMRDAASIDLRPVVDRVGGLDLVLVSPNDPDAMLRHTAQCRELGIPFAADPSQQLSRLRPDEITELVTGARWLFTNEYEAHQLIERTGLRRAAVLDRVGAWVTTLGGAGARVEQAGRPPVVVPAVRVTEVAEPTGAGDAFRAGFLAGLARGLPLVGAARLGCALAATALESVGPQEYTTTRETLDARLVAAYGADAGWPGTAD
ncbi:carbohydrate kinase family protein [Streptomyces hainanensis]|uniref:Carbohydrate kinase family protein n=1 Tax=Streptomyces hainanensis TaxID=402648 RepID=A0A4V2Y484_9ACTN|nr:carbohydrate kinase family protein [Streptomyces hainanensis]TDC79355.1 carbohydrate kinase family protein [Streptomyces hainanensis]